MWSIETTAQAQAAGARYSRKHAAETAACYANLDRVLALLNGGQRLGGFRLGFLRYEGKGVYRIGQTGVEKAHETRLYVGFDENIQVAYVLGLGDKQSQPRDISSAQNQASALLQKED
jgi:hypothetical protein